MRMIVTDGHEVRRIVDILPQSSPSLTITNILYDIINIIIYIYNNLIE